jgi:hypothetical protein
MNEMADQQAMNELLDEGQATVKASRVYWLEQAIALQAYHRHGCEDSRLVVLETDGGLVRVGMREFWK